MPERRSGGGGATRLSPQTLIVASLASLTAAIVTSTFWQKGTPITAAVTPVIVALASELYSRPARRLTEFGARSATRTPEPRAVQRERVAVGPASRRPPARPPLTEPVAAGPVRIYRSEGAQRRRRVSLRVAIVTAAIAFLIALLVLTLPELVFGGSVASSGNTTFFGGGSHHKTTQPSRKPSASPQTTTNQSTTTAPQQTTTGPPPAQTTPQTTTPGATPPAGGTTAPQTTTPAQPPPAP